MKSKNQLLAEKVKEITNTHSMSIRVQKPGLSINGKIGDVRYNGTNKETFEAPR